MAHTLRIPQQFEKKLAKNTLMQELVLSSVNKIGTWLGRNKLEFFPEYTKHGLSHVEEVLKTANKLIRKKCRGYITPQDVAALTLAALLHDCAMHLSKDGFAALIKRDDGSTIIEGFADQPWGKLWDDFIAEARRFSGRKLMAIFGNIEPIERRPPLDKPGDIKDREKLLIGEFLRRHHHRLAHEIALYGVSRRNEDRLRLESSDETEPIIDLAGLIARSHGIPMRICLDYVKDNYTAVTDPEDVHPVFLMALLRIADILQIQRGRAPQQIRKTQAISSPHSEGEWEMHRAIKPISWNELPETLLIHADPPNVRTYLRIKHLLTQIQQELDEAWTVIGEVYGYDEELQEFGLTIRRVRSNLDDEDAFAQKVEYVPCHAAFDVADSDLLKLLIGPLYGEKPEIGIRELMQNSLDAVRELEEYRKIHPELKDIELTEQEGEVVISIDQEKDDSWWVTVSDRGIGMTVDIVINYFLKAGASLRRSELWRETFEDADGKSRVLRSGRFGVGVLAAYLLGDEISVATRYVTDPEGIKFTTKLDAEFIQINKLQRPVGTTIRVKISHQVKDALKEDKWDWYCLTSPTVVRKFCGKQLPQRYALPPLKSELLPNWHRITHPNYADIQWTSSDAPSLTCNGIIVTTHRIGNSLWYPHVSIFDFDARLPLTLHRDDLTGRKYPFDEELAHDFIQERIAYILINAPERLEEWFYSNHIADYFTESTDQWRLLPWFTVESGFSFAYDSWHSHQLSTKSILLVTSYCGFFDEPGILSDYITNISYPIFYSFMGRVFSNIRMVEKAESINEAISFNIRGNKVGFFREAYDHRGSYEILKNLTIPEKRILISRHTLRSLEKLREEKHELLSFEPLADDFMSLVREEWKNEDWMLWQVGKCPPAIFDFEKFAKEHPGKPTNIWLGILAEWYMKDEKPEFELSRLAHIWRDVLGTPIIPFDLQERRRVLANAYDKLQPYIEAHEKMKQEGYEKFGFNEALW